VCVCVCVDLVIHHANRMRHTVICSLSGSASLNTKRVFWRFLQILYQSSLILRRTQRDTHHKCAHVFMQRTRYYSQILIKLVFSRQSFRKMCQCQISPKSVE
jgi:hypothetical protein